MISGRRIERTPHVKRASPKPSHTAIADRKAAQRRLKTKQKRRSFK